MIVSESLIAKRKRSLEVIKAIGEKLNSDISPREDKWLRSAAEVVNHIQESEHRGFQLDLIDSYGEVMASRLLQELK